MTNKEINMAILNKLYEIAEMIWQKMVKDNHGSYRASDIAKNLYKTFFWGEEVDMYQPFCVEVDSFRCEFTAGHIFRLISKFETLAGIGKQGEKVITVKMGENWANFATDEVLAHSFNLCFKGKTLLSISQLDVLYLGMEVNTPKPAVCGNGYIYMLCPYKMGDAYVGEMVADGVYDAGKAGNLIDLLQQGCEITTPVVSEKKVVPVISSSEKAASSSEKKKKSVDDSRKFTFDKIGIEPGDIITFIYGGQRVITIDNNKVVYQGKVYTLSGFCKEFMPDDRRNKANSYRGCAFFAYKGVKLDKMFKEALKAKEHADLAQDKEEDEKETKHLSVSVPAAIIKMNIAELLASPSYTRDFKPVCGYLVSSPIIVPFGRDKDVGARKTHYLVGVAAQPMPPPGNARKLLPLQGERGAPMITQGVALG